MIDDKEFELKLSINACQKCPLHNFSSPVPFFGKKGAKLIVVGNAPKEMENKIRVPFSSNTDSGKELREWLKEIGMKLDGEYSDVMLMNRQCCWPHIEGKTHQPENISLDACADWLAKQIDYCDSRVILAAGKFACKYFFPNYKITKDVGKIVRYTDRLDRVVVLCYNPDETLKSEEKRAKASIALKRAKLLIRRFELLDSK